MGYDGMKTALAASKGEKVEADVDTGANLITKANMNEPAVAGTAEPEGQVSRRCSGRPDRHVRSRDPASAAVARRRPCSDTDAAVASGLRPILELRGLEKRYRRHPCAEAGQTSRFKAGEIHAIVGENGAGKSTLIKLLTGVIPRTSGEIIWKGRPVDSPPRTKPSSSASTPSTRKWCSARI